MLLHIVFYLSWTLLMPYFHVGLRKLLQRCSNNLLSTLSAEMSSRFSSRIVCSQKNEKIDLKRHSCFFLKLIFFLVFTQMKIALAKTN